MTGCTKWALLGLLLSLAAPGAATIVEQSTLADSVASADRIVVASCESAESIWIGRRLYTRYRFDVEETVRGAQSNDVQVLLLGGVDLDRPHPIAMIVPGTPAFVPNQRALLLLRPAGIDALTETYTLTDLQHGAFTAGPESSSRAARSSPLGRGRFEAHTEHVRALVRGAGRAARAPALPLRSKEVQ